MSKTECEKLLSAFANELELNAGLTYMQKVDVMTDLANAIYALAAEANA